LSTTELISFLWTIYSDIHNDLPRSAEELSKMPRGIH